MTIAELTQKLEAHGYSFVTVVEEQGDYWLLNAIDPAGRQIDVQAVDETLEGPPKITLVLDRAAGTTHWDIMFIGEEPFL